MSKPLSRIANLLKPKRRWVQFSLASMFIVVTVLCGWLGSVTNRARRQREAVLVIESWGGRVEYADQAMMAGFGNSFTDAVRVTLRPNRDELDNRERTVTIYGFIYCTNGPAIDDDGLGVVAGLDRLECLDLCWTKIGDSGLAHLAKLASLRELQLVHTDVTDAGLVQLSRLQRLECLSLDATLISDRGIGHLARLTRLRQLSLRGTDVTDAGVAELQKSLPDCKIDH